MEGSGLPFLTSWQTFYVIMGAAAATLTGLMFVAITLIVGIERQLTSLDAGVSAYNTPTIIHFCAVLLMAGILSAPWKAFTSVGLLLGLTGLAGGIYLIVVIQRMRRVPNYQTPLHDWIWYIGVPLIAYIVLIVAAAVLPANPELALYLIGAVMLVLLFIGLHNAWDLVIFLALQRVPPKTRVGIRTFLNGH